VVVSASTDVSAFSSFSGLLEVDTELADLAIELALARGVLRLRSARSSWFPLLLGCESRSMLVCLLGERGLLLAFEFLLARDTSR
jgi:hypothetical protein